MTGAITAPPTTANSHLGRPSLRSILAPSLGESGILSIGAADVKAEPMTVRDHASARGM
jgi:hypothetical protein